MRFQYCCTICEDEKFESEKKLVNHMLEKHMKKEEIQTNMEFRNELKKKLETEFPGSIITVDSEGSNGLVKIGMEWSNPNAKFEFRVPEEDRESFIVYENEFKSIEDAISHYKNYFTIYENVKEAILERYDTKVKWEDVSETKTIMDKTCSLGISVFNGYKYGVYRYYVGKDIAKYIEGIKSFFLTEVEGKVEEKKDEEFENYSYWIGDVKMEDLLERAEEVKLVILKHKV